MNLLDISQYSFDGTRLLLTLINKKFWKELIHLLSLYYLTSQLVYNAMTLHKNYRTLDSMLRIPILKSIVRQSDDSNKTCMSMTFYCTKLCLSAMGHEFTP
jgi:hypothetical protein